MNIFNQFKRNVEWNKEMKSRDKLKKEIKELNIESDTAASKVRTEWYEDYDGSDTHTTYGPFTSEYTDGKVIMPALEGDTLGAYIGLISWINYMGETDGAVDRINKWYEQEQTNFITKICLQGIDTVNILAEDLARYEEKLGTRAIAVIPPEYGKHKQLIRKFFYQCLAIGILNGSIPDKIT